MLSHHRAKELEHYQRVRRSFENSSPAPQNPASTSLQKQQSTIPAALGNIRSNGHLRPGDKAKGKGKGKATRWNESEDEEEDDEAYVTSNDFPPTPEPERADQADGRGYGPVGHDDDDELYN